MNLFEPFDYTFFVHGLVVATIAGALCGLMSVYVVLRSMSYIGHGLSHAVFGGAAASALIGVNFFVGAGLWGVVAALLIGRVSTRSTVGADAAIGVVTTASFAIGLVILARSGQASRSLDAVLFGNVLGVHVRDIVAVLIVAVLAIVLVVGWRRELLFVTFDPDVARVSGISVDRVDALLMLAVVGDRLGFGACHRGVAHLGDARAAGCHGAVDDEQLRAHVDACSRDRGRDRIRGDVRQLVCRRPLGRGDHPARNGCCSRSRMHFAGARRRQSVAPAHL